MSSPTPVRNKLWVRIVYYPAVVFLGIPTLAIWVLLHVAAIDFACNCMPIGELEFTPELQVFGAILTGVPLLFADWFVWWKWRDYRRKEKWAKAYAKEHASWYSKTGNDRPTEPIKNKYYEP
ncbi:MAG TPA: hypothetical protein EYG09_00830 [Dehalococcoidia bacterium]|nr:hypothetical protein [Dehalococcoidia bacterium]